MSNDKLNSVMTPQAFIQMWEYGELVKFTPQMLDGINLDDVSRRFLLEAGLPKQANFPYSDLGFQILSFQDLETTLPGYEEFELLQKVGQYRLLAANWFLSYIGIDETQPGAVIRGPYKLLQQGKAYFVNSSIPQFAECLIAYRMIIAARQDKWPSLNPERGDLGLDAEQYDQYERNCKTAINEFYTELLRIDPVIFKNKENYWCQYIEDAHYNI